MKRNHIGSGAALAAAAGAFGLAGSASRADVENIYFNDFDALAPVTSQPNDGGPLSNAEPFFYSYSGNDPGAVGGNQVLRRRVGIAAAAGVGGTNAAFLDMDASAVKLPDGGDTWWFAGIGRYVYNDPFVGGPYASANKVTWTVDAKGDGLSPILQDPVVMRFAVQPGGGLPDSFAGETPGFFDATYNTIGGTLDSFAVVGGSLAGFSGASGFIAQLQPNTGAFGNDAGNRMTIDNFRVSVVRSVWKGTAGTSLDDPANWSESTLPNGDDAFPIFRTATGTPQTLTLNTALVVNRLDFEGADAHTINGTGGITIRGNSPGALVEQSNDVVQTINVPVTVDKPTAGIRVNAGNSELVFGGGLTSTGALGKDRNGRMTAKFIRTAGALNILGGQVALQAGQTTTSKVAALTFAAGTGGSDVLELNDGRLIIDYAGASPLASLQAALAAGKIKSSRLADNTAIVVAERGDFASLTTFGDLTPDATSILILATLRGDSDLNRTVNFPDLLTLASNYNTASGATWARGDSNGDGAVNFPDLLALASNYNQTLSASQAGRLGEAFAAEFARAVSMVPEPASLAAVGAVAFAAGRHRRRR